MEYLVNGKVDLYFYRVPGRKYYYVEKHQQLYQLTNKKIIAQRGNTKYVANNPEFFSRLRTLLSDSNLPVTRLDHIEFSHSSLIGLIKEYNENTCDYQDCNTYIKTNKKVNNAKRKLNFGISIGNSWTTMNMDSDLTQNDVIVETRNQGFTVHSYEMLNTNANINSSTNSIVPRAYFEIGKSRRTSFQIELIYQKLNYSNVSFTKINIPMLFNYNILVYKKIIPFLNLGVHSHFPISTNFKDLYVNYNETIQTVNLGPGHPGENDPSNSSITTNYTETMNHENISGDIGGPGFILGGGLKYQLSNKALIKFEIRYMNGFGRTYTEIESEQEVESDFLFKSFSSFLSFQYSVF